MSLTFSDRGTSSTSTGFRRGLIATLVVLGLVIAAAGVTTIAQGPKLRQASVDEQSAVRAAPVVTLRSDRAIASVSPENIRVTPEASFQLEQGDVDVRIVFDYPLQASTTYTIDVEGVTPRGLGAQSTWSIDFATPGEELYFLRAAGENTELVRLSLGSQAPEVIHSAPGIRGFARVGVVVALHRVWEGESIIELVDPVSGAVDRVALSPDDVVTGVSNSSWGTSLVLTIDTAVNGQNEKGVLALLDTVGARTPEVILGANQQPLRVLKLAVSPVTGNIVVWLRDKTLMVFEPLTGVTIPLGDSAEFWGFDSLGTDAVFQDAMGTVSVDVRTREVIRIPAGTLEGFPVSHELTTVSPEGLSYQRVVVPGLGEGPDFVVVTQADDQGVHTLLVGSLSTPESIGSLQLSPNGQYLAVELNSLATTLGYASLTEDQVRSNTRVVIIDVVAGTLITDTPGFSFAW